MAKCTAIRRWPECLTLRNGNLDLLPSPLLAPLPFSVSMSSLAVPSLVSQCPSLVVYLSVPILVGATQAIRRSNTLTVYGHALHMYGRGRGFHRGFSSRLLLLSSTRRVKIAVRYSRKKWEVAAAARKPCCRLNRSRHPASGLMTLRTPRTPVIRLS